MLFRFDGQNEHLLDSSPEALCNVLHLVFERVGHRNLAGDAHTIALDIQINGVL